MTLKLIIIANYRRIIIFLEFKITDLNIKHYLILISIILMEIFLKYTYKCRHLV